MYKPVSTKFKKFECNDVPSKCFSSVNRNVPVIVQIGANDGIVGEDYGFHEFLYELEQAKVYLLEPIPKYFNNLPSVYDKFNLDISYCNFALTSHDGVFPIYENGGQSVISNYGNLMIEGKSWNTFVDLYNISNIDLLMLDCEGYEFEILRTIDYTKITPKVIRYEYVHIPNYNIVDEFLVNLGYSIEFCDTDPEYNKIAVYSRN